jgi:hypothetical protein
MAVGPTQLVVMEELVQAYALYEVGLVPVEFVKVTLRAPAVELEGVTITLVGAFTWLVSAWPRPTST